MFEALRRSIDDLFSRIRPSDAQDGEDAGAVAVAEPEDGAAARAASTAPPRVGTGYLPPPVVGVKPGEHPTSNLPPGADPSPEPSSRKLGKVMGPDALGPLTAALQQLGPRAFPFKQLILDRLTSLPPLVTRVREGMATRDHAKVGAAAIELQESCAILADELVHQAATVTKLASRLEKAVKGRDKTTAKAVADELQDRFARFASGVEAKRQATFSAGEKLARFAVGKNYPGVADVAPAMSRDASLMAFLANRAYPFKGGDVDLAGSLTDRTLRLQQALIARDWALAAQLGREMAVQAAIMADTTVQLAVQLISNARKVREVTAKVAATTPEARARLTEITARLTQAVPALTQRLDARLRDMETQSADLVTALKNKDFAAAATLAGRIALSAQIAQHGIVAKAASLLTVTTALEEAAQSGEADTIVILLEGV